MSGEKVFSLGSLFSGIGGLELGLEMTGRFRTVFQVEQSEYCRKVLRRHWPDAIQFEDVRNVGKGNLPAVDVICGGFPCQDVSHANPKGQGLDGDRSGLWYEFARIVSEIRPRFVVVENVAALVNDGLDRVTGRLSEFGYDCRWSVISACSQGAPHTRERVFIIADSLRSGLPRRIRAPHKGWRSPEGHAWSVDRWPADSRFRRMGDGIPRGVDRIRALGNAVVPACARVIGEWLLEIDAESNGESAA